MPVLQNRNIVLRPLRESDITSLAALANNLKIWMNVRDYFPSPYTREDAETFIRLASKQTPQTIFAIEFEKQFCGVIGLTLQTDVHRYNAEIGYWLGEPFWYKGIAVQAVNLITQYAFENLQLLRLYAGVFAFNKASMRVLEKCGYQKEAVLGSSLVKNGKITDEHLYSKLNSTPVL